MRLDGDARAQVVLLAAVVVAVALVSMSLAYHGLGYSGDVQARAATVTDDPATTATQQLQRAIDRTAVDIPSRNWSRRASTGSQVRDALTNSTERLRRRGSETGIAYVVTENTTDATEWAAESCPNGPMRQFGPCVTDGGIVLQERANETVLVGVSLDVEIHSARSESKLRLRLRAR